MDNTLPNYRAIVHCPEHGDEDYTARELAAYVNASVEGDAHTVGRGLILTAKCPGEVIVSKLGSVRKRNAKHI